MIDLIFSYYYYYYYYYMCVCVCLIIKSACPPPSTYIIPKSVGLILLKTLHMYVKVSFYPFNDTYIFMYMYVDKFMYIPYIHNYVCIVQIHIALLSIYLVCVI